MNKSMCFFFFSSRRRHTRCSRDWSSDVCSSDLFCEIWHHQRHQRHAALIWEAFSRNAHNHEVSSRTKPFDCLWELHTIDETHPSELYQRSAPLGQRSGKRSEEHTSELQSRLHLV